MSGAIDKKAEIIVLLGTPRTFAEIAKLANCSSNFIAAVAHQHPELRRDRARAAELRMLASGAWTQIYLDRFAGEIKGIRRAAGRLLRWQQARHGHINLAKFNSSDLDEYIGTVAARYTPMERVAREIRFVPRIVRCAEPEKDWTWLISCARTRAAALTAQRGKQHAHSPCVQRRPSRAPIDTWPVEWRRARQRIPEADPVAALLGKQPSRRGKDAGADRLFDSGISAFVEVARSQRLQVELSLERVLQFIGFQSRRCKPVTMRNYLQALLRLARSLGGHLQLEKQIAALRNAFTRLFKKSVRRKDMLVLPSGVRVLELARDLMAQANCGRTDDPSAATRFQNGLMLLVMAFAPIRAANLVGLERRHWDIATWPGRLFIPAEETKTGRDLEIPLPEELRMAFDEYWDKWRPVLAGPGSGSRLWALQGERALSMDAIRTRLKLITHAKLGIRITLHDFRDVAATTAAILLAERPHVASAVLGHYSRRSVISYLQVGVSVAASKRMTEILAELRRDFKRRLRVTARATREASWDR